MGLGEGGPQRSDWWTRNEKAAKAMLEEKYNKGQLKKRRPLVFR